MALADTAELIVALKLQDRMSGPLRAINSQIDNLSRNATVRGGLGQVASGIGVGLRNAAILGAGGVAILSTQIKAGVESLRELENVEAQTAAALKSTGGVSGQTAESIRLLSEEYETLGGVLDDKVIQSGLNVLLTFRRIDKQAFEPALEAALNLSTAFEQDLQTSIVQVGKALEDPITGMQNLRRVGVQFTEQQQDQIKALVEANDLYGAQRLILAELEVQVGGRFAAAGRTNEATVARMGDAWEDLQQTLTRATLPAIDRVSRRLTEIFSDPTVIARVEEFGDRIAGFLNEENLDRAESAIRGTFGYLASIPWGAIGDGLRIAGQAAKVAVDAFRSLPPGVQNTLITLLAANKLTGGLVSTGLAQLAAVALGRLTHINAGNVTVVGANVTSPGAPVTGGGGGFGGVLATATAIGAGVAAGLAVGVPIFRAAVDPAKDFFQGKVEELINGEDTARIRAGVAALDAEIANWARKPRELQTIMQGYIDTIREQRDKLAAELPVFGPPLPRRTGARDQSLFPGFSEARNVTDRTAAAIQPLTTALNELKNVIITERASRGITPGFSEARNVTDRTERIFVDSVKLDPSQVTDLREPTRIAAEQLRMQTLDARAADMANRTANAFITAELARNRSEQKERLTSLAAKYDTANAQLSGAHRVLTSINAKTPPTHPVTVNNAINIPVSISASLIEQRLVTYRQAAIGVPTAPKLL